MYLFKMNHYLIRTIMILVILFRAYEQESPRCHAKLKKLIINNKEIPFTKNADLFVADK